jgi:ABC-type Fe3+-siderophore transport system permease subunit
VIGPRVLRVPRATVAVAAGAAAGAAGLLLAATTGLHAERAVLVGVVTAAACAAAVLLAPQRAAPLRWPAPPQPQQSPGWHLLALRAAGLRRDDVAGATTTGRGTTT